MPGGSGEAGVLAWAARPPPCAYPSPSPTPRTYADYSELAADYEAGALHPGDLKPALIKYLNAILQPVRGGGV